MSKIPSLFSDICEAANADVKLNKFADNDTNRGMMDNAYYTQRFLDTISHY